MDEESDLGLGGPFVLLPFEMQDKILSYLGACDVKNTKCVNSFWRRMVQVRYNQVTVYQLTPETLQNSLDLQGLDNVAVNTFTWLESEQERDGLVKRLINCMDEAGSHLKCLKIEHQITSTKNPKEETGQELVTKLLSCVSGLSELRLVFRFLPKRGFWYPSHSKLLNVTTLQLHLNFWVPESDLFDTQVLSVFQQTPNVVTFSCTGDLFSLKVMRMVQQDVKLWPWLKNLECYGIRPTILPRQILKGRVFCQRQEEALPIQVLGVIRQMRRHIRSLSLHDVDGDHGFLVGQILDKHKTSLKHVEISISGWKIGPNYPREMDIMPGLESFSYACTGRHTEYKDYFGLRNLTGTVRDIPLKFPKLSSLCILLDHDRGEDEYDVIFPPHLDNFCIPQVRWLDVDYHRKDRSTEWRKRLAKMFPNVDNPSLNQARQTS